MKIPLRVLPGAALVLLPAFAASTAYAAPPEDEEEGEVTFEITDSADEEAPPDEGGDGDDGGDDEAEVTFEISDDPGEEGEEVIFETSEDPEDDDGGFEVEDLSDDPEAAAKELEVETKAVKGASGYVIGTIKDETNGDLLVGVLVYAVGTDYKARTDAKGEYRLELPVGEFEIELQYDGFKIARAPVKIVKDGEVKLNDELSPDAELNQTFVIEAEAPKENAAAQLQERKKSTATKDVMSGEDIKKSGGGSTASVAKRIVGATIIDGKYLFVRGLGHRYGNTLLDGARVPSPEPDIRTIPLDIFPSGALSGVSVVKSFSPDMPGDFAGASVQLETRTIPDSPQVSISVKTGVNSTTTGQRAYRDTFRPGDAFGFGNLSRALPDSIPTDTRVEKGEIDENFEPLYSDQQIEQFGEDLAYSNKMHEFRAPPLYGIGLTLGNGHALGKGHKIGYVGSVDYGDKWENEHFVLRRGVFQDDGGIQRTGEPDYVGVKTVRNVSLSGLGMLKYQAGDNHSLGLTGFYSRDSDSEARNMQGFTQGFNELPVLAQRHRYIARGVLFTRLGGEHTFPKAKDFTVDWFGSYSQARRDDPALREISYVNPEGNRADSYEANFSDEGKFRISTTQGSAGSVEFYDLTDNTYTAALNLTQPFKQWKQLESQVKIGAWADGRDRLFTARRFAFRRATGFDDLVAGVGNPFTDDSVGSGVSANNGGTEPWFISEVSRSNDAYDASERIFAGYGKLDLPFARWFKVTGGARYEYSRLQVLPFDQFDAEAEQNDADLQSHDVLPVLGLIFSTDKNMNVRLSGAQTLARPELRELSPFSFTNFAGGFTVQGNEFLDVTKIWNADLRWEWFPSGDEVVAASAFFKYFDAPIESVVDTNNGQSFINATDAVNVGGELELRKNLEFLGRKNGSVRDGLRWLADLSVGFNVSVIYSRVRIPEGKPPGFECEEDDRECAVDKIYGNQTTPERALQGQAPWTANAFFDYDNEKSGTRFRLLYNAVGPYISLVGAGGVPNYTTVPLHLLDLTASQRLFRTVNSSDPDEAETSNELRLNLGVKNMLDYRRQVGINGLPVSEFQTNGVTFTLGLSYSY